MNRNIPILGFILGVVFPLLGMLLLYFLKFDAIPFGQFVDTLISKKDSAATILSLSLLANAIPFIYYTNKRLDHTARGIFIATMLYAVLIVLLKWVW